MANKSFLEIISNSKMMKSCDSLLMIVTKYENEKSQNIFEFFKAYCKWKFKKSLLLHVFLPLFGNFFYKRARVTAIIFWKLIFEIQWQNIRYVVIIEPRMLLHTLLFLWTVYFPLILMNKPSHQQHAGWSADKMSKSRLIKT